MAILLTGYTSIANITEEIIPHLGDISKLDTDPERVFKSDEIHNVTGSHSDYGKSQGIVAIVPAYATMSQELSRHLSFSRNLNRDIILLFEEESYESFNEAIENGLSAHFPHLKYIVERYQAHRIEDFPSSKWKAVFLKRRESTIVSLQKAVSSFFKKDLAWNEVKRDFPWGKEEQTPNHSYIQSLTKDPDLSIDFLFDEKKEELPPLEVLAPIKPMHAASLLVSLKGKQDIQIEIKDKKYRLVSGAEKHIHTKTVSLPDKNVTEVTEIWKSKILLWQPETRELIELD